jgi:cellulose synthase/poly-beta-1,6-N-acetylglucosamine synthase-like glycosyltransferase
MRILASFVGNNSGQDRASELPRVSIITAVYNEEAVLPEKLQCLDDLDYPRDRLHIYFGSDKSQDSSNDLLSKYEQNKNYVTFVPFEERRGKIGVINRLGHMACEKFGRSDDHILLYNDANVMLEPDLVSKLVTHFTNKKVALVDANMLSRKMRSEGISKAERHYINREVLLKHWEGKVWGLLQGAFGGCYCLRSDHYIKVPEGFLVDDFFISFHVMMKGYMAINDVDARCYESASHDIWQEFKRKSRISAGNFQNLSYIIKFWSEISFKLKFCFVSHKVIRWFGPILLLLMLVSVSILSFYKGLIYTTLLVLILVSFIIIPTLDLVFIKLGLHFSLLRKVRYFIMMNIALFKGLIRYVKGVQNGFWEPPKRV